MSAPNEGSSPKLSIDLPKPIGRVYREPSNTKEYKRNEIPEAIYNGELVPSITNVLDVKNIPYLQQWAATKTAREAIRIGQRWPEKFRTDAIAAERYLKNLHNEDLKAAATRGTNVHQAMELLALGQKIPNTLTEDERKCVISGEKFFSDFNPIFKHVEVTGFGTTSSGLKFAGTTDFIADFSLSKQRTITVAGDYKCTTLNTPILLENGGHKLAKDIAEGDKIVAWSPTRQLHIAEVAWVSDNGKQPIVKLRTEHGQTLNVTKEHPILVLRDKKLEWVQASEIRDGDIAHLASGWNHNPNRVFSEWDFKVSPYAVGVIWAIINSLTTAKEKNNIFLLPPTITKLALSELKHLGIKAEGGIVLREELIAALGRNIGEGKIPFLELFSSPGIPADIFTTSITAQEGFLSGVREIFMNRKMFPEDCVIHLSTLDAVEDLQQLYLNLGIATHRGLKSHKLVEPDSKEELFVRVPKINSEEVSTHGPVASKIVYAQLMEPEQTIAIEVEGSHTHVTAGIITHNTTRSGLHASVAIQLNAIARTQTISPDDKTLIPTPKIDTAIAVHLSPKRYEVVEVEISDEAWNIFEALRALWIYHAFDGDLTLNKNVLLRTLASPKDFLLPA